METARFYEFGPFRIDSMRRLLLRDEVPQPLTPKAFDILLVLIEKSGRTIEKDELMRAVWPDTVVEENNLTRNISALRKALGESPHEHQYVLTVSGRGYRFIGGVKELNDGEADSVVEKYSRTQIVIEEEEESGAEGQDEWRAVEQTALSVGSPSKQRRAARWRSSPAFLVIGLLLAGLAATLSYTWIQNRSSKTATGTPIRSIAILPFKPIGVEGSDEYLGLGMADALITRLGNIKQISVRSTSAVRRYSDPRQDPLIAGRELRVESVLDGMIQRSGDRVRVTVQLVNVRDGAQLWGEKFEENFTNIFAVQDRVSERVAEALALNVSPEERKQLRKRFTENTEAYQAYLLGRYFFDRSGVEGAVERAIGYYNQAIEIDPNFARAYAGLADAHSINLGHPKSSALRSEAHLRTEAAALKAHELDGTLAEAHTALGRIKFYDWNWSGAEKAFKRAIEVDPNYATARLLHSWYLGTMRRTDESFAELYRALELDPLSINSNTALGSAFISTRQYDRAIEQLRKTIEISPNSLWPRVRLAQAFEGKGMYEESFTEFGKAINLFKDSGGRGMNPAEVRFAQTLAFAGKKADARKVLAKWGDSASPNYDVAVIHIGLGERDKAFPLLHKLCEIRDMDLLNLRGDPRLDSFRSDPRYAELIKCTGLAP